MVFLRFELFYFWRNRASRSLSRSLQRALRTGELFEFFEWLVQMLEGGIALDAALQFLQSAEVTKTARALAARVFQSICGGQSLSSALKTADPSARHALIYTLISAGEEGGFLLLSLQRASQFLSQELRWKDSVTARLIYPLLLVGLCLAVALAFLLVLAPVLEPHFQRRAESGECALFALSHWVQRWGTSALVSSAAAVLVSGRFAQTASGQRWIGKVARRAPALRSFLRERALFEIFQALTLLIQARIDLVRALSLLCQSLESSLEKSALQRVCRRVTEGLPLSAALTERETVAPLTGQFLRAAEITGDLGGGLERIARFYERRYSKRLDRLARILPPALMLIAGALVACLAGLVMGPLSNFHLSLAQE